MATTGLASGHDEAPAAPVEPTPPDEHLRRDSVLVWSLVMAPYVVIAAVWARSGWFPVQDQALLALREADVFDGRLLTLGAFSRYGWSHPGPVWFYALAPFRLLGGGHSWMVVGSVLWFGAGIATACTLALRRFGRTACALAVVAAFVAIAGAGPFTVLVPWNPHLAFAWYPVLLLLSVTAARGRVGDLAAAVFVGSALVQLHVGYVVLVGLPLAAATVLLVQEGTLRHGPRGWWAVVSSRGVRGWLVATFVLWLPPLFEQLAGGRDGNLAVLANFFLRPPDGLGESTGWGFAAGALGAATKFPFMGLGGPGEPLDRFTGSMVPFSAWYVVVLVVLVAAAVVVAWRRGDHDQRRVAVMSAVILLSGLLALSRVVGDRWPYLFAWRFVLAWFVVATTVGVLGAPLVTRWRAPRPAVALAGLCAVIVLTGSVTAGRVLLWERGVLLLWEPDTEQLLAQLDDEDAPDGPVTLVRFGDILQGVGDAVLLRAAEAGWPVGVLPELGFKYGDHRVADPDADTAWLVTESSADTTIASSLPGARVLASRTPLSAEEDAELAELQLEVLGALAREGRLDLRTAVGSSLIPLVLEDHGVEVDPDVVTRLEELNRRVETSGQYRRAVVAVPAPWPVDPAAAVAVVTAPTNG